MRIRLAFSSLPLVLVLACSGSERPAQPGGSQGGVDGRTTTTGTSGGTTGDAASTTGTSGGTTGDAASTTGGEASSSSGGNGPASTTGGSSSTGTEVGDAGPSADASSDAGLDTGPFPPVDDFAQPGPYGSTTLSGGDGSLTFTVYRPEQLAPDGAKNPIVAWMSGGGTTHDLYALLPHLASHGFVVVAPDSLPSIGQEAALGEQLLAAISWALAENDRADSELYDALDPDRIASAGYSMGSLATFTIADDPRLTTTVHISGGNMGTDQVQNLRQPAAFICGTTGGAGCNILSADCDIAAVNCDADFAQASTPVFYANFEGGHLGILTPPLTGQISEMTTAWLRYSLMDDRALQARFIGADCSYCSDPAWKVQQKNL